MPAASASAARVLFWWSVCLGFWGSAQALEGVEVSPDGRLIRLVRREAAPPGSSPTGQQGLHQVPRHGPRRASLLGGSHDEASLLVAEAEVVPHTMPGRALVSAGDALMAAAQVESSAFSEAAGWSVLQSASEQRSPPVTASVEAPGAISMSLVDPPSAPPTSDPAAADAATGTGVVLITAHRADPAAPASAAVPAAPAVPGSTPALGVTLAPPEGAAVPAQALTSTPATPTVAATPAAPASPGAAPAPPEVVGAVAPVGAPAAAADPAAAPVVGGSAAPGGNVTAAAPAAAPGAAAASAAPTTAPGTSATALATPISAPAAPAAAATNGSNSSNATGGNATNSTFFSINAMDVPQMVGALIVVAGIFALGWICCAPSSYCGATAGGHGSSNRSGSYRTQKSATSNAALVEGLGPEAVGSGGSEPQGHESAGSPGGGVGQYSLRRQHSRQQAKQASAGGKEENTF